MEGGVVEMEFLRENWLGDLFFFLLFFQGGRETKAAFPSEVAHQEFFEGVYGFLVNTKIGWTGGNHL